jgi:hypothetical protein
MNQQEFQNQINRLEKQFGKYGTERCTLLWREVKDLNGPWFERVMDQLISSCRQAPLLPEFREEISRERERLWRMEKEERKKDAHDFFEGSYQPDDIKTICQVIKDRINRKISDQDYQSFVSQLENAAKGPRIIPISCVQCSNTGLIFHRDEKGYEFIYRCTCTHGQKKPKGYPALGQT